MRSADISMLIIIQMYGKLKRVHTTNYVYYFFINDFQRSKGGSTISEKKLGFRYVSSECIQWQNVARVEIKRFITIRMTTLLLQGVDKM